MIVSGNTWANHLPRNHLMGAYHSYGEQAYNQLCELFGRKANTQEMEVTLIILSDSGQSHGNVGDASHNNGRLEEGGDVNSSNKISFARRKLMFDDGGPQDLESTNKKPECYYIPGANGTMERVRE
ncbi:hypothetical protein SASPL_114961 [Salvia splendens]|uniref:Uncharacterized protein n=1 Tax=Salvia splendens TaxID=180675 RepID=A0A8X9A168_SALSN|nr:hypothetical protein SASPL_114961 [Salvia splendens]